MSEPALDLSEIIDLYIEDAKRMVSLMQGALARWEEFQRGGAARQELRRLSHQLMGSGRTHGFRNVTRIGKAIEGIVQKVEKDKLPADATVRESLREKIQ